MSILSIPDQHIEFRDPIESCVSVSVARHGCAYGQEAAIILICFTPR